MTGKCTSPSSRAQFLTIAFSSVLDNLFEVYVDADDSGVLETPIPDFYEKDDSLVLETYQEIISGSFTPTTITEKYKKKKYAKPTSVYHDLKVAAAAKISAYKVGTDDYKNVDFFFKFATELLLRELSKLGLSLKSGKSTKTSIEAQLAEEFEQISNSYSLANGEALVYVNESEETVPSVASHLSYLQPTAPETKTVKTTVFSPLVGKSEVDPRKTLVPEPYNLTKVVPVAGTTTNNTQLLKTFNSTRLPVAATQPTKALDKFFHPNWYTIDAPKWLIYKQNLARPPVESSLLLSGPNKDVVPRTTDTVSSFVPIYDSTGAVVSQQVKDNVWFNHIGKREIAAIKRRYLGQEPLPSRKPDTIVKHPKLEPEPEVATKHQPVTDYTVNLAHLVKFNPELIKDLEILKAQRDSIAKSPRELQRLISTSLLRLNRLRQQRYLSSSATKLLPPTAEEIKLYQRVEKLLTLLLELKSPADPLNLKFSKSIPILMNEYGGTLPGGPPPSRATGYKSTRLASIRSSTRNPYRKRRF